MKKFICERIFNFIQKNGGEIEAYNCKVVTMSNDFYEWVYNTGYYIYRDETLKL